MILLLLACMDGPNPLTTITDVRVLNLRVEPASPVAGERPQVELLVVDPDDPSPSSWTWWCAQDTCDEEVVPEGQAVTVFGFACTDCEGPGPLPAWRSWMQELPFEDHNLAQRIVPLSPSAQARINTNPVLALSSELPGTVAPEEAVEIGFSVEDAEVLEPRAYGYATAGGFSSAEGQPVEEGATTLTWTAPEEPGEVQLYVIVEDGLGGSDVWSAALTVE